ncbi:MAG: ribosome maturation factor RimP [Alphaproteobacteria bacterium]|nr:ribosome maturation factor RimP [Alphaproteobacteria bacterium]
MQKPPLIQKIEAAITPTASDLGYDIVRVLLIGSGRPTLQVMAEQPDGTMEIEDCEKLSKALSALLDVEDIIDGAYTLEVSSPGIDRPLTRFRDFENHIGFEARVEMDAPINGQKKFKGKIHGTDKGAVVSLETEDGMVHSLPFTNIQKAKLMLTDELLKSAQLKQQVN